MQPEPVDEALRREQELLRSTIENAPIVLFATDIEGIFTVSRGSALAALGLRDHEALGRSAIEMYAGHSIVVGGKTVGFPEAFRRVLSGETIEGHAVAGSAHFDVWLAPRRDRSRIVGSVGVALDVTTRSALEQRLQRAERFEALGVLAGGVAHGFNNLLTAILGHAEILAADLEDDRLRADVDAIRHAAESAAAVTNQLLAFTRRQYQELQPFDLNDAVRSLEPLLRRAVGDRVVLELRLSPEPVAIVADVSQIEHVILNLTINARDAMPDGGTVTISTAAAGPDRSRVELAVADTGVGIDPALRERIFEPFFTTKERGRGTGLGLASVHGIVAQTGGEILVDSRKGGGARFRILLPAVPPRPDVVAPPSPSSTPTGSGSRGRTILVAEHDQAVRALITTMLTREGYRVFAVATAAAALDAVRANPDGFDLVVSDAVMPGMSGRELAGSIAAIRASLQIVFASPYADAGGLSAEIRKPFTREQLLAAVSRRLA